MRKTFLFLFFGTAVLHLIARLFPGDVFIMATKPMLMILLGAYYLAASSSDRSVTVLGALLFSLVGDVLLLKDEYFIGGLICFLLAHLFYILAYAQHQEIPDDDRGLRGVQRIRLAFPIVLAGTGLIVILYPVIGDLRIPVMIYALVITIMVLKALYRYGRTSTTSFVLVFGGAVLFMVSDSMIAIDKFLGGVPAAGFWIMLTYIAAQYLIVDGLIRHTELVSRGQ
ncbi:MAG TPA: lysoplasmalogenase [Chryseosolibacter sp.]|nr:lysoplasmalogenase [Chryseosolibacter sp.]